jgi:hypothetical protein
MPNFITAMACGSLCRFIKECLDQYIACKPVGRRRQLQRLCTPAGLEPVGGVA